MTNYRYYTQAGNQFTLKVQKGLIIFIAILLLGVVVLLFTINPDTANILIGIMFLGLAVLVFLRTTAITIIDTAAKEIIVKPFSFSQAVTYNFRDYEGINNMAYTNYGVKGTSTVGLRFNVQGKLKEVRLLQSFMSTKSLHNIVKETEQIMAL